MRPSDDRAINANRLLGSASTAHNARRVGRRTALSHATSTAIVANSCEQLRTADCPWVKRQFGHETNKEFVFVSISNENLNEVALETAAKSASWDESVRHDVSNFEGSGYEIVY